MTAGEHWTSVELDALRSRRFRPSAWSALIRASLRRASDTRDTRSDLTRQARTWSAFGLFAGVFVIRRGPFRGVGPGRFAAWWLLVAAMLDWHLGMLEGPNGERRDRLRAADALTLVRLWTVPFLVAPGDPVPGDPRRLAGLVTLAAISDGADGILARRAGTTRLGRDLDTVADAVTGIAAARAARTGGWLSTPVAGLVIARSVIPTVVVTAGYFRSGRRPAGPYGSASRRLAPMLFAGLAVSPFRHRTGAALCTTATIGSLALAGSTTSTATRADKDGTVRASACRRSSVGRTDR
jgi:phosphatidylglycerophosphate synthase